MPSNRPQSRFLSPAMLVALLALVVSLGGTATAAKLITGKDIKDNTVTTKDLKNNNVSTKDVKDGTIKLSDLSPAAKAALSANWDPSATLVSGRMITGSTYYIIDASSADQALNATVAFPARAPVALANANFAPDASPISTDDDASCTGTYEVPSAPAGMVCGYLVASSNLTAVHLTTLVPGENRGFIVRATAAAAGSIKVDMSWAYTAP